MLERHEKSEATETASKTVVDGWENCKDEDFDKYVNEKVAPCIRLSYEMAKIQQTRLDPYRINVIGPFSLAISCVLAEALFNTPTVTYKPWPTGHPEHVARATASAFDCLCRIMKDSGHQSPSQVQEKFKDGVLKAATNVICALGSKAREAFGSICPEDSIWKIIVEHEYSKDKSLLHLCKVISQLDNSSPCLAHLVLEQDYQVQIRDLLKFIKVLCQKDPSVTSEVDAEEVRLDLGFLVHDAFALACIRTHFL